MNWSHTRTYSNQQTENFNRGNGWNWNPTAWPYLSGSPLAGSSLTLFDDLYDLRFFSLDPATGLYSAQYSSLATIVHDTTNSKFVLTETDGTVRQFHDFSHSTRPGGFISRTEPGGNTLSVVQESGDKIVELQQSAVVDGDTVTESMLYQYFASGASSGQLQSCTLRRKINTGSWEDILRATYDYYGSVNAGSSSTSTSSSAASNEMWGSVNDLRSVTRQEWDGSAWQDLGTSYYRYYKSGDTNGNAHNIKFVCRPAAYAKLSAATGGNPDSASDATVALYADSYFEYDANNRVVLEQPFAGSETILFTYERNPRYPDAPLNSSSSSYFLDQNVWIFKTTETLQDGSQRIIYANYAGLTMLYVVVDENGGSSSSGTAQGWCSFSRYNERGQKILSAEPSAVLGYDEDLDDLLGYNAGTGSYQYLRNTEGLISLTEYYEALPSSSSSGSAPVPVGYTKSKKIQQGQQGSPILLSSWEYTSHAAGGSTIFPVSKATQYPDDTDDTKTIETTYSYTFYTGTTQVEQRTTTLPVVTTTQNGSGTANSRMEYYDQFGYLTWTMDERGFLTNYTYDVITGALVQRIDDVDTSVVTNHPTGWSTPSGGGLNLVTDYESDDRGRITQELGPVHTVDIGGTATLVRTASWTVYDDANHTTRSAQGYATGSSSSYTYTLVNPVQITQRDGSGKVLAEIQATRASTSGRLLPSDTFAQSSYTRWKTYEYTDCCLLASERVYHTIPASGEGASGTNYDQTNYGYDLQKRRNRVVSPGGTITFTVFDVRSLVTAVYVGTDDTGATAQDPTGNGATGNNMVVVTSNVYDQGQTGGDGNLTQLSQHVDASTTRVTDYAYDFRNRRTTTDGEINLYEVQYYDNLNRVTQIDRRDTSATGNLIARSKTEFDDLSRVYQAIRYGVDPATGTEGNPLKSNTWYDQTGNVVKSLPAGSSTWTKTTYDGLGRPTVTYVGYGSDSSYSDIFSVTGDVIYEQSESVFDAAGNLIQATQRQRYHDALASQTGALGDPSTTPKARVTYSASYPDGIGREQSSANYGTNGGSSFTRSATIPTPSDTILVTSQTYDDAGNLLESTDPAGMVTRFSYDDAGRRLSTIENYVTSGLSSSSSSSTSGLCDASDDENRTTSVTYTPDGNIATLTAVNASTGNQVTTYTYGTTLSDSDIATSSLLRQVTYPDSTSGSDTVTYSSNRQRQRTATQDQNGSVHAFNYDLLGRLTQDRVTTLGTGVDGTVRRLELDYEVRGLPQRMTSWDNSTVGSGNVLNEVKFAYNEFGQSITAWQAHAGAVDTMTTPKVQYEFVDGTGNTIRPTKLTYPNSRYLSYYYGTDDSINESASRVEYFYDSDGGATRFAEYSYLGRRTVAVQASPEPGIENTLLGDLTPDGDIYTALDRFGRLRQSLWKTSSSSLSDVQYGYDRASSRIWRKNPTDTSNHYDWLYGHDSLHRLKQGERGTLNGTNTGITSPQFSQCWSLDATGNWQGFRQDDDGDGTWDFEQDRSANPVNEITALGTTKGEVWGDPQYDANGNMTTIPRANGPYPTWANFTPDEWDQFTADQWDEFEAAPTFQATYDAWNRLVKIEDVKGTVQENEYDARGFRVVKKSYTAGSLDETRHYYYSNSWQVLEERVGTSTTPDRHYVWGQRYIDELICRDRTTTSTLDERLYALQDANWNVTTVVDDSGTVQERYEYDPYGVTSFLSPTFTTRASSDFDWETTYAGYRWDTGVQVFAIRHRYYSPNLGTWLARDPLGQIDGPNLYRIRHVLRGTDPLGLAACTINVVISHNYEFNNLLTDNFPGEDRPPGGSQYYPRMWDLPDTLKVAPVCCGGQLNNKNTPMADILNSLYPCNTCNSDNELLHRDQAASPLNGILFQSACSAALSQYRHATDEALALSKGKSKNSKCPDAECEAVWVNVICSQDYETLFEDGTLSGVTLEDYGISQEQARLIRRSVKKCKGLCGRKRGYKNGVLVKTPPPPGLLSFPPEKE
ncbi:MAG: hypothetical protein KDA88_08040 [Planctomycetaceae bacterium]|nr:hypothetical protein [Planctomycetaceae bacterium]MCB9953638.1 RHS repeat-associated core domain-containing protein [Planctomycetaceae bacterium]